MRKAKFAGSDCVQFVDGTGVEAQGAVCQRYIAGDSWIYDVEHGQNGLVRQIKEEDLQASNLWRYREFTGRA